MTRRPEERAVRVRPGAVMHDAATFEWSCAVCCSAVDRATAHDVVTKMPDGLPCVAHCCSTTCRDAYVLGPELYRDAANARAAMLREP